MALLETLRADSLAARKAGITKDKSDILAEHLALAPHATFLVSVLSDVVSEAKNAKPPREPTDEDADRVMRTTIKRLTDAAEKAPGTPFGDNALAQIAILKGYLPEPLDEHALKMAIRDAADFQDVPVSVKSIGLILKRLNSLHPGQVEAVKVKALLEAGAC